MEQLFGYLLTEEEANACKELVVKIREEKERKRIIAINKLNIECAINLSIEQIGLEETKKMVMEFDRTLRRMKEEK